MRIRRRPQAQALIPSPPPLPQASSDPPQSPPPGSRQHWLPREEEEEDMVEKRGLHPTVDLGGQPPEPEPEPSPAARRAGAESPPQGDNVVGRSSENNHQGSGVGGGAQRQGGAAAADGHAHGRVSLENGHRDGRDQWPVINPAGEERIVNGVMPRMAPLAAALDVKDSIRSDGAPRRRRGPAVLLEGSRCSRVNGRGWRCSQPTLVGYALCEHHLGKGRQSRSASANGGRSAGAPKLGRTEPAGGRKSAAALAVVAVAALPDAAEPAARLTAG